MKNNLIFFSILYTAYCILHTAPSALASCDFYANMTNTTKDLTNWTTTCTVATGVIDGIDKATLESSVINTAALTLSSGGSITINAGGELIVGSLDLDGGSIAIQDDGDNSGTIQIGAPLYIADDDADGWPLNFTLYNSTASGRRRLTLMRDFSDIDCNDTTDYRLDNSCCVVATRYQDSDGDGYGNSSISISDCATAGYVDDNTDCYDSNANAYPNSTYCSGTNRGDGSYDYNCDSASTNCAGYSFAAGTSNGWGWARTNCAYMKYYNAKPGTLSCGSSAYGFSPASMSTTSLAYCQSITNIVTKYKRLGPTINQCN